jgi:hypothetical protein
MAINPNTDFTAGSILLASQQNRFPRGIVAMATSTTTYTLTTSVVIATGMSVTFTPVANRYYKITYYEPQAQTPTVLGNSQTYLKITNAAGTTIGNAVMVNESNVTDQGPLTITKISTFAAVSTTLVGCGSTSATTGGPTLLRGTDREALLLVEDLGPA